MKGSRFKFLYHLLSFLPLLAFFLGLYIDCLKTNAMIPDYRFNQLMAVLEQYLLLPPKFKAFLKPLLKYKTIRQGDYLIQVNDAPEMVYFNCSGCFQENTLNSFTGEKEPTWFWFEDYFIFTTPGFFSQTKCQCDVVALTDAVVIYMTIKEFNYCKQLFDQTHPLSELIREQDLKSRLNHGKRIAKHTAEEVLKSFYKKRKLLFNLAKRKDIAHFLGIEYDTMRRLLNKIS